jgi:hypothetical protein
MNPFSCVRTRDGWIGPAIPATEAAVAAAGEALLQSLAALRDAVHTPAVRIIEGSGSSAQSRLRVHGVVSC